MLLLACAPTALALDPPVLIGTDQASPANDNNPKVKGTASADTTAIKIYTDAACTEPSAVIGGVADLTGPGIVVPVPDNTTTTFSGRAVDDINHVESACSNSITYVEDSTPPDAPVLTGTDPLSPANENSPKVMGTVGAGSPTGILIYVDADCTEPAAAAGTIADFTGPGIPVSVPDNSTTAFAARSVDGAGNASACSNSITYAESTPGDGVNLPPPAPPTPAAPVRSQSTVAARPAASFVLIAGRSAKVGRSRKVTVALNCSGNKDCSGRVVLSTAKMVRFHHRVRTVRLGSANFEIPAPRTAKIKIRLSRAKYRLLRHLKVVKALVTVTDIDRSGRARVGTREITLRA